MPMCTAVRGAVVWSFGRCCKLNGYCLCKRVYVLVCSRQVYYIGATEHDLIQASANLQRSPATHTVSHDCAGNSGCARNFRSIFIHHGLRLIFHCYARLFKLLRRGAADIVDSWLPLGRHA